MSLIKSWCLSIFNRHGVRKWCYFIYLTLFWPRRSEHNVVLPSPHRDQAHGCLKYRERHIFHFYRLRAATLSLDQSIYKGCCFFYIHVHALLGLFMLNTSINNLCLFFDNQHKLYSLLFLDGKKPSEPFARVRLVETSLTIRLLQI